MRGKVKNMKASIYLKTLKVVISVGLWFSVTSISSRAQVPIPSPTPTASPTPRPTPVPCAIEGLAEDGWVHIPPSKPGQVNVGVHGGNRRVTSSANYGGVQGEFSGLMNFSLGDLFVTESGKDTPTFVAGKNPNSNKPSVYLGGSGRGFEIDSGAVYEALSKDGLSPGWSVFTWVVIWRGSEKCGRWFQPRLATNRVANLNSIALGFRLTPDGKIILNSRGKNGESSSYFPAIQDIANKRPIFPDVLPDKNGQVFASTMTVKRIIALTQGSNSTLDNSYYRNVSFSKGQIQQWIPDGQGGAKLKAAEPWISGTHAYLPSNPIPEYEKGGVDGGPLFYVDSAKPWHRLSNGSNRPDSPLPSGVIKSRYEEEAVNINMLAAPTKIVPEPQATAKKTP